MLYNNSNLSDLRVSSLLHNIRILEQKKNLLVHLGHINNNTTIQTHNTMYSNKYVCKYESQ